MSDDNKATNERRLMRLIGMAKGDTASREASAFKRANDSARRAAESAGSPEKKETKP